MSTLPDRERNSGLSRLAQLDSLKSRLQTTKTRVSVPKLAYLVYQEEGVKGFYRGLWIPLVTISFVREYFHTWQHISWLSSLKVLHRLPYTVIRKNIVVTMIISLEITCPTRRLLAVLAAPCRDL